MSKILFYAMTGEKLCFLHVLMNAVDLAGKGHEVKVIFEGRSVALAPQLDEEKNPLFLRAREAGLIAGVCRACAKQFGVDERVEAIGLRAVQLWRLRGRGLPGATAQRGARAKPQPTERSQQEQAQQPESSKRLGHGRALRT